MTDPNALNKLTTEPCAELNADARTPELRHWIEPQVTEMDLKLAEQFGGTI